jgi:hypothetical protein
MNTSKVTYPKPHILHNSLVGQDSVKDATAPYPCLLGPLQVQGTAVSVRRRASSSTVCGLWWWRYFPTCRVICFEECSPLFPPARVMRWLKKPSRNGLLRWSLPSYTLTCWECREEQVEVDWWSQGSRTLHRGPMYLGCTEEGDQRSRGLRIHT